MVCLFLFQHMMKIPTPLYLFFLNHNIDAWFYLVRFRASHYITTTLTRGFTLCDFVALTTLPQHWRGVLPCAISWLSLLYHNIDAGFYLVRFRVVFLIYFTLFCKFSNHGEAMSVWFITTANGITADDPTARKAFCTTIIWSGQGINSP